MQLYVAALCLLFAVYAPLAMADDLASAPPSFAFRGQRAVPVDFQKVSLSLTFDINELRTIGVAEVDFYAEEAGFPIIDLVPNPLAIELNGETVSTAAYGAVGDPDQVTYMRILAKAVAAKSWNHVRITYKLRPTDVTLSDGSVRAGFFMSDLALGGREFWEQYAPANLEFDQYQQVMLVKIVGSTKPHTIWTNGSVTEAAAPNEWVVRFPDYFNAASFYFHITPSDSYVSRRQIYAGIGGSFPITIYGGSQETIDQAMRTTLRVVAELERTYGPYAHNQLLIYLTPTGGGMEYCGATMTSMWALEHEVTHSWFARGVMPANGNAGWIDEAVASWRDDGYKRYAEIPTRAPTNLGGFSPYRRHTAEAAYTEGSRLIGELDYLLRDFQHEGFDGMRGVLRALFGDRRRATISVSYFEEFLEQLTGLEVSAMFKRYVFGKSSTNATITSLGQYRAPQMHRHPRPYTSDERQRFR